MSVLPLRPEQARRAGLIRVICLAIVVMQGCRAGLVNSRQHLTLLPEAREIQLGKQAYEQALASEPPSQNPELVAMVERVGQRLALVANKPDYDWEFRVIARDTPDAFALPGGKVAVNEGLIPLCQSEAGLAVVLSHEIAHAIARHGSERMTQHSAAKPTGGMLDALSPPSAANVTADMIRQGYGIDSVPGGATPFSRQQESEADAIGLILMAKAGYDPSAAPEVWQRFSTPAGSETLAWMTTHPGDARRAADLRALLPEAMKYYEAAEVQLGMGDPLPRLFTNSSPAGNNAPLAKALQPAKASVVVGEGAVKRGGVKQILHSPFDEPAPFGNQPSHVSAASPNTEPADDLSSPAADSSEFKLPIKQGTQGEQIAPSLNVNAIDSLGWESSAD